MKEPVSIRFVAKGLRQLAGKARLVWSVKVGFYSLCREGSSSTVAYLMGKNYISGFYSLCREGSSSTTPAPERHRIREARFYSLCREGSSSTCRVLITVGEDGVRFYSLCREGSSSTWREFSHQPPHGVSIRFVAKGLRQLYSGWVQRVYSSFYSLCREGSSSTWDLARRGQYLGFYSLCREGSSSTTRRRRCGRSDPFLFALSRRVFVNRLTTGHPNWRHCFYSLCREGSSSTETTL